jgi:hypothetical protein
LSRGNEVAPPPVAQVGVGRQAFLAAPILLHLPTAVGASAVAGIQTTVWICLAIAAAGALAALTIYVLGAERLQAPDLGARRVGRGIYPAAQPAVWQEG